MIYIGIDIAKFNHFASAISSDGEILMEPFQFSNDINGFHMLLSWLDSLESDNNIIGLESTAYYGDNLVRYLVASSFKVCILNPIKTSSMRKNNIRKTKTDKVDTYIIAKTLMLQDSYKFFTFYDLDLMDLKQLATFVRKLLSNAHVWRFGWLLMWMWLSIKKSQKYRRKFPTYFSWEHHRYRWHSHHYY